MLMIKRKSRDDLRLNISTLQCALLDHADLHRAILIDMVLSGCSMKHASLRNACIDGSNFESADLSQASFILVSAVNTIFSKANLQCVQAIGANFENAMFINADLGGADIGYANFNKTNLCGTILLCDRIDHASFEGAIYNNTTKWPDDFDPNDYGAINTQN